jgi:hypothetical protein
MLFLSTSCSILAAIGIWQVLFGKLESLQAGGPATTLSHGTAGRTMLSGSKSSKAKRQNPHMHPDLGAVGSIASRRRKDAAKDGKRM